MNRKVFLQNYIMSLKERTRNEKKGLSIGFDWIIYNLATSKNWIPVELPFFRSIDQQNFITKTGSQFGVDMSFIDNEKLIIFVLKDEALNYKNWIKNDFDSDMRRASAPDLKSMNRQINKVVVILAYNKDEDSSGIESYNRLVLTFPKVIEQRVEIEYERWNLTRIVEEVNTSLISPDLLPQTLSGLLNYICLQAKDFSYGSEEWEKILLPAWKNFLKVLFSDQVDERKLRLIPVSLYIIDAYRDKDKPESYTGWIDLLEWAIIFVWDIFDQLELEFKQMVFGDLWHSFYLAELEKYLIQNQNLFLTEHGIVSSGALGYLGPLNDAYLSYWMIARIGIFNLGFQELLLPEERMKNETIKKLIERSFAWISNLFVNNPAAYRPLIDLDHIQLFLVWMIIYQVNRTDYLKDWLSELESRLVVRRVGNYKIPFIEGRNRYDLVAEYAATFSTTHQKPDEFVDNSSYLLTMLLEIMFSLNDFDRDEMLNKYWKHIVLGLGDDNESLSDPQTQIDLQSWIPPEDWSHRIFKEKVVDGISVGIIFQENENEPLHRKIYNLISQVEEKNLNPITFDKPLAAYILACIKNESPLPPIFWRGSLFPELFAKKNQIKV